MSASDRAMLGPAIGLAVAAVFGAGLGVLAIPRAAPELALVVVGQLAVAALGLLAPRWPVLWTAAVALVGLCSTLATDDLAALAFYGAAPWANVATSLAAQNLFRRARRRRSIVLGSVVLGVGSLGLVSVVVGEGVPPATAVVTASVPYLVGVLVAVGYQLRDARADRASGLGAVASVEDRSTGRALALVALRADELARTARDEETRNVAADLRGIATRAMSAAGGDGPGPLQVQVVTDAPPSDAAVGATAPETGSGPTPADDLPERERAILRLVSTGASNAEIARDLYLSEATVKQYVSRLMKRLDRRNRTELALLAAPWFGRQQE